LGKHLETLCLAGNELIPNITKNMTLAFRCPSLVEWFPFLKNSQARFRKLLKAIFYKLGLVFEAEL
jgi:hypothetical protein